MSHTKAIYILRWSDAVYIGQARDFKQRMHEHRHEAAKRAGRLGKGTSTHLYRFWRKHGQPDASVLTKRTFPSAAQANAWADEAEVAAIAKARASGSLVLNSTAGGTSAGADWWKDPEIRARHRVATRQGMARHAQLAAAYQRARETHDGTPP